MSAAVAQAASSSPNLQKPATEARSGRCVQVITFSQ
nr:MAG TPA: hypothetical protein [Caudoviricetes sp.]